MGLSDKTTPTLTTLLIRANMSCAVSTNFSSLAFLSSSISMANLSRLVAASFSSLALLYSSISTANLSCLLVMTFCSLRFSPTHCRHLPRFNLLRATRRCFLWFSVFFIFTSYPQPFFPLSSVSEALLALSLPFLSERGFLSMLKQL